ncbi:GNAT family N-acetyltransferase [Tumidithrix elongata RA019]|uniref:GNAT family N-acetyltransferase n=1 Tax=Tumidithrix elongata BACA0141 TaxID=2716417 RepID=A0AAW9PXM5_9CYAN|nr:GNAT family N-acetyltransferase [Tumidithrix elongata RA019]
MAITFKLAEFIDIDPLIELVQEFYRFEHMHFDRGVIDAVLGLLSDETFGRIWLIYDEDSETQKHLAGYVALIFTYSLETHGRNAMVDELFLRSPHRGKGIGKEVFRFLEDFCQSMNMPVMHLLVDHRNAIAHRFYIKKGFKQQDRYILSKWLE